MDSTYNFRHSCNLDKVCHNQAKSGSEQTLHLIYLERMALCIEIARWVIGVSNQVIDVYEETSPQILSCPVCRLSFEVLLDEPLHCVSMLIPFCIRLLSLNF